MKILDHLNIPYDEQSEDCIITCLDCSAESKCSVSKSEGNIWQCYRCKRQGNSITLIQLYYASLPELTKQQAQKYVHRKPGVPLKSLRDIGVKYCGRYFWFPVYSANKKLIALTKYCTESNIAYGSPKPASCSIMSLDRLTGAKEIWVAEGQADYLVMLGQMKNADRPIDLLGTSGSGFAGSYLHVLEGKDVVLLYDNDKAGQDGVQSVARRMKQSGHTVGSIKYLDWSKIRVPQHEEIPDKFDIRDLSLAYSGG